MSRRHPRSTRTDTLFPYTTLFRSQYVRNRKAGGCGSDDRLCAIIEPCLAPRIRRFIVIEIQGTRIRAGRRDRSEEHTSELQSLMRNSYAVYCLKKKKQLIRTQNYSYTL